MVRLYLIIFIVSLFPVILIAAESSTYDFGWLDPDKEVDHIDNNSLNNNPDNLRESLHSQNMHNSKTPINNTSGYKGIFWHKASGKWEVRIRLNGKLCNFGLHEKIDDAIKVAMKARKELHGTFGRDK